LRDEACVGLSQPSLVQFGVGLGDCAFTLLRRSLLGRRRGAGGFGQRGKNRASASRLVHRVPPIWMDSKITPRQPEVVQR